MGLLQKAENTQAFAKIGLMGFAGSGKTYTAWLIASGIHKKIGSTKPIAFMDTETGSDYMIGMAKTQGIEILQAKTRAFADALSIFSEVKDQADILIIDSVTHIWRELCDTYAKKRNLQRLRFQDWAVLKAQWGQFTDLFVNAPVHTIIAGRAGYEYDYHEGDDGKLELHKTGTKMKVEGEFGYEPSLLIEMVRVKLSSDKNPDAKGWTHRAYVLKDRTDSIDGAEFDDPDFSVFAPHFDRLNIGGRQLGVDLTRESSELFTDEGETKGEQYRKQKQIVLEEVYSLLEDEWPGTGGEAKKAKNIAFTRIAAFAGCTNTRSKTEFESRSLEDLKAAHCELVRVVNEKRETEGRELEPVPPYWHPTPTSDDATIAA